MVGTWGPGNLDADAPRDFLESLVGRWAAIVDEVVDGGDPDEARSLQLWPGLDRVEGVAMPAIELMIVAIDRLGLDLWPEPARVGRWSEKILATFDAEAPGSYNDPPFQAERRAAVVDAFDRLLALIRRREAEADA